jgi:hypothetical protein
MSWGTSLPDPGESAGTNGGGQGAAPVSVHALLNGIFLVLFVCAVVALAALDVTPAGAGRVPLVDWELPQTCVVVRMTGRPCSSCGITRSIISAAHGDIDRSRRFHPAGVPLLAMVLGQCAMRAAFLWPRLRRPVPDVAVSAAMALVMAWLLNG